MTPVELTALHRRQQLTLRRATVAELERLWPALNWDRLDASYPRFALSVAAMVRRNRTTSMGLAARYLRAFRIASGLPGGIKIVLPQALPVGQFDTTLRVTSVVTAKKAAGRGATAVEGMSSAQAVTAGAISRLVLEAGRDAVLATTAADPEASGWQRILGGRGCDFCHMLAERGAVYSEETSDFASHDNCGCSAAPVYEGATGSAHAVQEYTPSEETDSGDRARAREWLRNHPRA